ncbi:MAG: 1,4-alpha-glucan branching enzyme [Actinobacteria bacterium 13_2_20CM_2_71_6]|nr:MAG: 1,4-alpha-glucan branching enzyme [Actinobacteria bacterium 13_2_20CM_2_71_6]
MDELISGAIHDPHAILGAHPKGDETVIRTLRRGASTVAVIVEEHKYPATRVHDEGVFEATVPGTVLDYRVEVDGEVRDDPYRHPPTVGELDLHLISEGRHERLWDVLGAHAKNGGVSFAVWAPNARGVRMVGDSTGWGAHDGGPMRSLGSSGVWEVFVPGIGVGDRYKYRILGRDGVWRDKADPMAQQTEAPPRTASIVTESRYEWKDAEWLAQRAQAQHYREPVSVYEVHLGSWRPGLSYVELADQLTDYVVEMGFTHVELMPVMEHPFGGSWGYQVSGYYAPTARFGEPDGLRHLIDRLHQAGVGVILDWVPAHFPRDEWALARFDGTPLYEHGHPWRGEHPDWGTYVFDFGRREVRNFLVANALYWCDQFHIDGLRVDAVASMLYLDYSRKHGQWAPNQYGGRENLDAISFLQEMNATVYKHHPGVMTVAEESTAWPGVTRPTYLHGLGFGFKWNMGWMNDTLSYVGKEPIYRQWHHHQMTFSLVYAWSENYILPISHDEVVHGKGSLVGKMPGDMWQKLANARALLAFMWAHPGKQLIFMGSELADEHEWSESQGLNWNLLDDPARAGMQRLVRDLNAAYRSTPALWMQDTTPDGFRWISSEDSAHNTFSFVRYAPDGAPLVCVVNFAGIPHERLPASAALRVPPLGALWLRPA